MIHMDKVDNVMLSQQETIMLSGDNNSLFAVPNRT